MISVKSEELSGAALDWAVAVAEGYAWQLERGAYGAGYHVVIKEKSPSIDRHSVFRPSSDWSQGGPLIDKYKIEFCTSFDVEACIKDIETMRVYGIDSSETHLEAACRVIVYFRMGGDVQVPVELIGEAK